MNQQQLSGKRIAILATDGVEQVELLEPRQALQDAGAQTQVISIHDGQIQGVNHDEKGERIPVDATVEAVRPDDYDGLMLPGGVMNPDSLRMDQRAVRFVSAFSQAGKPIAAICHGPWMLVEAGIVRGKTVTSWPSLQTDIRNAGGQWVDRQVVVDQGVVTSRKPDDIPAFNEQMIAAFASGSARQMQTAGSTTGESRRQ